MTGDAGYALQQLELAIDDLASGPGDIRSRLGAAFETHLHVLSRADFPDSLGSDWNWILEKLTRVPPIRDDNGQVSLSSLRRTLKRMHNSTGTKIAKRIVSLRDHLKAVLEDLAREP